MYAAFVVPVMSYILLCVQSRAQEKPNGMHAQLFYLAFFSFSKVADNRLHGVTFYVRVHNVHRPIIGSLFYCSGSLAPVTGGADESLSIAAFLSHFVLLVTTLATPQLEFYTRENNRVRFTRVL